MKQSSKTTHRGSDVWRDEVKITSQISGWEESVIRRINMAVGPHANWIKQVGRNINEMQIQFDAPIKYPIQKYDDLELYWVEFNTYEPITKKPSTRTVRFSWDTGTIMVLVRSPKEDGNYDYYLLGRRKYHIPAQGHVIEFDRGWTLGKRFTDAGLFLFNRDFASLETLGKVWHTELGNSVYENDAEFCNFHGCHLFLVTLDKPMSKDDLKSFLVEKCLEKEYANRREEYPDLSLLGIQDLVNEPVVMELADAAKALNAHVAGQNAKSWLFGEDFSIKCWARFLALYGDQFPHLKPEQRRLPD